MRLKTDKSSSTFEIENLLPQGSSINITLFLIVNSSMISAIILNHQSKQSALSYKKQLTTTVNGPQRQVSSSLPHSFLYNYQKKAKALEIKIQEKTFTNTKCIYHLGLTFDDKLNWKEHIKNWNQLHLKNWI